MEPPLVPKNLTESKVTDSGTERKRRVQEIRNLKKVGDFYVFVLGSFLFNLRPRKVILYEHFRLLITPKETRNNYRLTPTTSPHIQSSRFFGSKSHRNSIVSAHNFRTLSVRTLTLVPLLAISYGEQ